MPVLFVLFWPLMFFVLLPLGTLIILTIFTGAAWAGYFVGLKLGHPYIACLLTTAGLGLIFSRVLRSQTNRR